MNDPYQLLRISEVSQLTTLGKSTIILWVSQEKFPKPMMLSPTIKVWRMQQIVEWIELGYISEKNSNSSTLII
jgi:prophage regulatory protein